MSASHTCVTAATPGTSAQGPTETPLRQFFGPDAVSMVAATEPQEPFPSGNFKALPGALRGEKPQKEGRQALEILANPLIFSAPGEIRTPDHLVRSQ